MKVKKLKLSIFNALDITVILVVVAVIISTFFKIHNMKIYMIFNKSEKASITVSIDSDSLISEDLKVGERVYLSDNQELLGKITSVKNIKEKKYTAINNSLVVDYTDKNVGVLLEIESKLKESSSKKYVNGSVFVAPGTRLSVYSDSLQHIDATIEDISIK